MGNLVAAVMAAAILGVVAAPIMALSLQSVKDRADSSLSLDAEAKALAVRKQAAAADSLAILNGSLQLTTDGVTETVALPEGCTVAEDAELATTKVTCRTSRGGRVGTNSQPLYTAGDFASAGIICYSSYANQAELDKNNPERSTVVSIDEFNALLTSPGNSSGGGGGFFTKLHPMTDPNCLLAEASGGTYTHPDNSGGTDNDIDDDNDDKDDKGKDDKMTKMTKGRVRGEKSREFILGAKKL